MARKNPTMPTRIKGAETTVEGIELPNAGGISSESLEKSNRMPGVNMSPNDGDQKGVSTPAFATGKDERSYRATPSHPPTPGMPGA